MSRFLWFTVYSGWLSLSLWRKLI